MCECRRGSGAAGGANIASVRDGRQRDGQSVRLVRDRLSDAILRGEIGAGEVSSQTSLSEEFGAGRSVVREALRLLDMEGLVIREPNKRVRVAELTAADANASASSAAASASRPPSNSETMSAGTVASGQCARRGGAAAAGTRESRVCPVHVDGRAGVVESADAHGARWRKETSFMRLRCSSK
jgi:hypothetical protein